MARSWFKPACRLYKVAFQRKKSNSCAYQSFLLGGGALSAVLLSYSWICHQTSVSNSDKVVTLPMSNSNKTWSDGWIFGWNNGEKSKEAAGLVASSSPRPTSTITCSKCKAPVTNNSSNFIADAVESVLDSVVNIFVETDCSSMFTKNKRFSQGTGFVISNDGTILTNAHVVSDAADYDNAVLTITASDGVKFCGILRGIDLMSDLAVIKVVPNDDAKDRAWKPVVLSEKSELRPGDWVVAVGSPLGLHNTVTAGVISSSGRKVTEIGGVKDNRVEYIQTDCVIHPGSSGGPLINLSGQVIGVNTSRADQEGISFAIRVDNALGIIKQMASTGRVVRPWLGATLVSLTPQILQQIRMQGIYDLLPDRDRGALVTYIYPQSPAERAGLLEGDVILSINGHAVDSGQAMYKLLGHEIANAVDIIVERKVALDVDWDGRVSSYETQTKQFKVSPDDFSSRGEIEPDFFG